MEITCSRAVEYEHAIQRMFQSKLDKTTDYTHLLHEEEKRCTGLLTMFSGGKDGTVEESTLTETKLHCKKLGLESARARSQMRLYSSSLFKVRKVLNFLVKPCNVTKPKSVLRSVSRDNMIKNLNTISKHALRKADLLYSAVNSTLNASFDLSNLYNRKGERLLDILITKSKLLNLSVYKKAVESSSLKLEQLSELREKKISLCSRPYEVLRCYGNT